jgi:hypothetical protein
MQPHELAMFGFIALWLILLVVKSIKNVVNANEFEEKLNLIPQETTDPNGRKVTWYKGTHKDLSFWLRRSPIRTRRSHRGRSYIIITAPIKNTPDIVFNNLKENLEFKKLIKDCFPNSINIIGEPAMLLSIGWWQRKTKDFKSKYIQNLIVGPAEEIFISGLCPPIENKSQNMVWIRINSRRAKIENIEKALDIISQYR